MLRDRYQEVFSAVNALPLQQIIEDIVPLKHSTGDWSGVCPIHKGCEGETSFKFNPYKNVWKCFHCGEGGNDVVKFYQKVYNLSYSDALMKLAYYYKIISPSEYFDYTNKTGMMTTTGHKRKQQKCVVNSADITIPTTVIPKKESSDFVIPVFTPQPEKAPISFSTPASPTILDSVYRIFIESSLPIPDEKKVSLMQERFLTEAHMKDFFYFPSNDTAFWDVFKKNLKKEHISVCCLRHVPGFYYDQFAGRYAFNGQYVGKLGIVFRNNKGQITGIQIRLGEEKKKYIWFSSAIAAVDPAKTDTGWIYGTAITGEPDILPSAKTKYIACTEGKFKAIKLHDMGIYTLNLFGVGTWSPEKVDAIASSLNCKKILLCYDADCMKIGHPLTKNAVKFSTAMHEKGYEVQFIVWDPQFGKGIDDVINNGYKDKIHRISFEEFLDTIAL